MQYIKVSIVIVIIAMVMTLGACSNKGTVGVIKIIDIDTTHYPKLQVLFSSVDMDTIEKRDITFIHDEEKIEIENIKSIRKSALGNEYLLYCAVPSGKEIGKKQTIVIQHTNGVTASSYYEVLSKGDQVVETMNVDAEKSSLNNEIAAKPTKENVSVTINQIDSANFPEMNIYFSLKDDVGNLVSSNDKKYFHLWENEDGKTAQQLIQHIKLVKQESSASMFLVLDKSGSMEGEKFNAVQESASQFMRWVNFQKGDQVAISAFDNQVQMAHFFSNDQASLERAIWGIYPDGQTALYDALYTALLETNGQRGAKCIIAFTDGMDNRSSITSSKVISMAKQLRIPIYIIGIGDMSNSDIPTIAEESGGYYTTIYDMNQLQEIYSKIFREQQEQMVLTYESLAKQKSNSNREITLQFQDSNYEGKGQGVYSITNVIDPNIDENLLNASISNMSDVEKAIYYYEHQFVRAVNSYDFNYLKDHLDPNGELYNTQKNLLEGYKKRGVKERLLYYQIEELVPIEDGKYRAVVNEQFYIQIGNEKASYKEFENTYIIAKTPVGYKVAELISLHVLQDTSIDVQLTN